MIQYNIYVGIPAKENLVDLQIAKLLNKYDITGANIQFTCGIWEGTLEGSVTITVIDLDNTLEEKIYTLVDELNVLFNQECILVTSFPISAKLIYRK